MAGLGVLSMSDWAADVGAEGRCTSLVDEAEVPAPELDGPFCTLLLLPPGNARDGPLFRCFPSLLSSLSTTIGGIQGECLLVPFLEGCPFEEGRLDAVFRTGGGLTA